jgi:hypothetical protein
VITWKILRSLREAGWLEMAETGTRRRVRTEPEVEVGKGGIDDIEIDPEVERDVDTDQEVATDIGIDVDTRTTKKGGPEAAVAKEESGDIEVEARIGREGE